MLCALTGKLRGTTGARRSQVMLGSWSDHSRNRPSIVIRAFHLFLDVQMSWQAQNIDGEALQNGCETVSGYGRIILGIVLSGYIWRIHLPIVVTGSQLQSSASSCEVSLLFIAHSVILPRAPCR